MFNSIDEIYLKSILLFKKNQSFLLSCVVLFFFFHGNEFFNFNLSVDDEMHIQYQIGTNAWVGQGRWFMYILNTLLLPTSVVPITTLFLYMIAVIAATFLQIRLWTGSDKIQLKYFLLLPFILGIPTISSSIAFAFQTYAIGFGILIATISALLFLKQDWKHVVFSGVLFSLSIGIYQGLIFFTLPIIFIKLVREGLFKIPIVVKYSVHILVAVIIHFIMAFLFRQIIEVETVYIESFWNPELLINSPQKVFMKIFKMMASYYSGLNVSFLGNGWLLGIIITLTSVSFLINEFLDKKNILINTLAFTAVLLGPFVLTLINGGNLPERTLLSLPITIGGLVFLGIDKLSKNYLFITGILICIFTIKLSVINNSSSYAQQLIYQHDRELSIQIYDRLSDDPSYDASKNYKLIMIGKYQPAVKSQYLFRGGNFRQSIYSWGHEQRIINFMKVMGLNLFDSATQNNKSAVKNKIKEMPSWPDLNSVQIFDDIVVLKFEKE